MPQNVLYFLISAGFVLFVGNIWSADFDTGKINFYSAAASLLMVVLGFVELRKRKKNEN